MSTTRNPRTINEPLARSCKDLFTTLCCFVLLGLSPTSLIAAPYQQATNSGGRVVIEAENYNANVSRSGKRWANAYPSGFSGTGALAASANTGVKNNTGYVTKSPRLDYAVNFVKTGIHYVWIRGAGPSGGDDSLHVGLDGAANTSSDRIGIPNKRLSWTNTRMGGSIAKINITTTGKHTLNIWMREDGAIVDKIVLTTSRTYTPANKGPSASARSAKGSTSYEPIVSLSTSKLKLGSQNVGGISDPSPIKLTNNGTAHLYISSINTFSNFIQTNNCNDNVSVGGSCVIKVKFVPTSTGTIGGRLIINSNTSPKAVLLVGTGADGSQPLSSLTPSGPIVINGERDVVISGLRISNPNGSCIRIKDGSSNIVIKNSEIGPCGKKGINIENSSNVEIRNNHIHDAWNEAIMSYKSHHIAVNSNVIEDVEAGYEMHTTSIGNLSFTNNYVKNVSRRKGSGNGGNIAMVAFVRGGGVLINNNIGINVLGESNPLDLINIFKSHGTPGDPIQIKGNKFYGGGPTKSSGGIMLGDQGGSYQVAENNILVNPGGYGIAIAGGHHNTLRNNKVYSPVDAQRPFANVGISVWRFNYNGKGTKPRDCRNHTVEFNKVTFWKGPNHKNNGLPAALNAQWNPGYGADRLEPNCGSIAGWNTNKLDTKNAREANLNMSIWNPAWNTP